MSSEASKQISPRLQEWLDLLAEAEAGWPQPSPDLRVVKAEEPAPLYGLERLRRVSAELAELEPTGGLPSRTARPTLTLIDGGHDG